MSIKIDNIRDRILDTLIDEMEDTIADALKDHLDDQPYSIECEFCGRDLNVIRKDLDKDYDLRIRVEPCDCQKDLD
jgi:hypothetical protein